MMIKGIDVPSHRIEQNRTGRTQKPCPSCGKVDHWRPIDKPCRECQYRHLENEEIRKKYLKLVEQGQENPAFYVPKSRLYISGIHVAREYGRDINEKSIQNVISENLMYLLERLSTPCTESNSERLSSQNFREEWKDLLMAGEELDSQTPRKIVRMYHADAEVLDDLANAIRDVVQLAYEEGARVGGSSLLKLASGEITMNEFTNAARSK